MTFSVAGTIITQANEAGIAITAATSIAGGVRFTCTQAYAAGNVVRITGTTNYNGDWIVAAATATTFDVLESAQGTAITFVSSQTGTAARGDASLAGLAGLTGVTVTSLDASSGFVTYTLADTYKLQVNGTLVIAGAREANARLGQNELLVIGQDAISTVQPVIRVGSGGVLVVGRRYTNTVNYLATTAPQYTDTVTQQYAIYQKGRYGWSFGDGSAGTDPPPATAFLSVISGGRFDWLAGTIDFWGNMGFGNGSIINFGIDGARNKPVMDVRRCSTNIWFHPGCNLSIFGIKVIGDRGINVGTANNVGRGFTFVMLTSPTVFKGFEPMWARVAISGSNVANPGGAFTIEDYAGAFGTEYDLGKSVNSGGTLLITFKNSAVGTTMTVIDNSSGTCLAYVTQKLTATVKTTAGVAIEDAVIWTISLASVQSLGVTNAGGQAVIDNIETGFSADNQSGVTARFAAGDVATWNVRAYQSLSAVYQVTMKGIGGSVVEPALVADAAISLSRSAAAALSTIATLNDFYDAAKYWNVQSANVNYPTATTQVATAVSAFAVNTGTNTVTIKASALAAGSKFTTLKTTGTISFANGATATCALTGIILRGTTGVYSPTLIDATVRFTSAGTYDLRSASITGTITFENTSGSPVTVQIDPAVSFVNSGPNITVDNAPPPVFQSVTVTNGVAGTRLLIQDVTNPASPVTLYSGVPALFPHTWTDPVAYAADRAIRVRAAYQSGVTAKLSISAEIGTATLANPALSYRLNQVDDAVYNAIAIDGSTVTEFAPDYPNVQVDISDPNGQTSIDRLYAWYVYITTTTDGILYWVGGIVAEDLANFKVVTAILNLKLDNLSASGVEFTGGQRLYRDDGTTPLVASTTGGGSITLFAGKVYVAETGTTGLTPSESAKLMGLPSAGDTATATLAAAVAAPIHANVKEMNDATVYGTGAPSDLWRGTP